MADIVAGMTIQAAWFDNIDTTGAFKRTIKVLNDTAPIKIQANSVDLASLDNSGNLKIKGDISDNETI